eukprot:COSAG01_NODE_10216_length_2219_cov_1.205660_3_plen_131_part_01
MAGVGGGRGSAAAAAAASAALPRLLTRRARIALGTATQCTRINDSPPPTRAQGSQRAHKLQRDRLVVDRVGSDDEIAVRSRLLPSGVPAQMKREKARRVAHYAKARARQLYTMRHEERNGRQSMADTPPPP